MRPPLLPAAGLALLACAALLAGPGAPDARAGGPFTCYGSPTYFPTWTSTVTSTPTATATTSPVATTTPTSTTTYTPWNNPTWTATATATYTPTITGTGTNPTPMDTPPSTATGPTFTPPTPTDTPPTTPVTPSGPGASGGPRAPSGPSTGGPTGPSGPTGPARGGPVAAGTDWHAWWGAERQRHWPAHRRGAAATGRDAAATSAPAWLAPLRARLEADSAWSDRTALAEGLAFLREPASLDLALLLVADRNDRVARAGVFAAAAALQHAPSAVPSLRAVLEDRAIDDRPRGAAAAALGALGDPAACDVLWRIVRAPVGDVVRAGALEGLGFVGDEAVVPQLRTVLGDRREDAPVRVAAAAALGQLARRDGARRAATQALLDAIRNPHELPGDVRQTVALNLGHAEASTLVVRRLAELCTAEGDARTRGCAALALGRLAARAPDVADRARRALVAEWEKEAPEVRAFLALGLGLGGCGDERRRLEGWLEGRGDPLHRGAAAVALGLLGDAAALPALARAATSGAPSLRGDACEAMGLIGGPPAAAALRELTRDGPDAQRGAAVYALGLLGQPADFGGLVAVLDAATADLRMGAAWGLAAFAGEAARDQLLAHAAREADPRVRAQAYHGAMLAVADRPLAALGMDVDRSPWARAH